MPASTFDTSAAPFAPAIFTDRTFACGATPFHFPFESAPLPAMIPAMNVPCPYESSQVDSPEKFLQGLVPPRTPPFWIGTTRPERSATSVIPVSTIATVTPRPVTPRELTFVDRTTFG